MATALVLVKGIFWLGIVCYFIWLGQRKWLTYMRKEAEEIQARDDKVNSGHPSNQGGFRS